MHESRRAVERHHPTECALHYILHLRSITPVRTGRECLTKLLSLVDVFKTTV